MKVRHTLRTLCFPKTMRPETAGTVVGVAAGVAVSLAGLAAWRVYARAEAGRSRRAPLSGPGLVSAATADASSAPALSSASLTADPIIREQLTRNVQFFGSRGQAGVCDALVVVVGLGVSF